MAYPLLLVFPKLVLDRTQKPQTSKLTELGKKPNFELPKQQIDQKLSNFLNIEKPGMTNTMVSTQIEN